MLENKSTLPIAEVLIVEDDRELCIALASELRTFGFLPLTAGSGKEALLTLRERGERIAAVVSDWLMPGLDGLGLLQEMRGDQDLRDIPFLLLTAKGAEADVVEGFSQGANDYLCKPFKFGELTARLKNLVQTRNLLRQLKEQATRDGLTGLYNHRYFMECLQSEIARQKRYGGELSLILLDIDHFKQLNDQHGHQTGDFVLKCLGLDIQESLRNVDVPCRYGGEEFAIILPMTSLEGAKIVADRLRQNIEQANFERDEIMFSITCSFGVGSMAQESGWSGPDFIRAVDRALYRAKEGGRNQIFVAEP